MTITVVRTGVTPPPKPSAPTCGTVAGRPKHPNELDGRGELSKWGGVTMQEMSATGGKEGGEICKSGCIEGYGNRGRLGTGGKRWALDEMWLCKVPVDALQGAENADRSGLGSSFRDGRAGTGCALKTGRGRGRRHGRRGRWRSSAQAQGDSRCSPGGGRGRGDGGGFADVPLGRSRMGHRQLRAPQPPRARCEVRRRRHRVVASRGEVGLRRQQGHERDRYRRST